MASHSVGMVVDVLGIYNELAFALQRRFGTAKRLLRFCVHRVPT